STPNNLFAIEPHARKHLLIAGGNGITPFLSHIPEKEQQQADWQLHDCFHDADTNAFVVALRAAPWRERVKIQVSALGRRLDLARR
ncbi:oxidoreductase, partial [Klebsiella quasipneumoniae]|nr:oxidoreductase [Klebsiella quasipneumoniae]